MQDSCRGGSSIWGRTLSLVKESYFSLNMPLSLAKMRHWEGRFMLRRDIRQIRLKSEVRKIVLRTIFWRLGEVIQLNQKVFRQLNSRISYYSESSFDPKSIIYPILFWERSRSFKFGIYSFDKSIDCIILFPRTNVYRLSKVFRFFASRIRFPSKLTIGYLS